MQRLFAAIDIPSLFCSRMHELAMEIEGARPVPRDQLHLTLKFIGDVERQAVLALQKALAAVRSPQFSLALQGVGYFPPRGAPRIVWVGIIPRAELLQLHSRIEQAITPLGYAREARPFSPHITISRLKTTSTPSLRSFLAKHKEFETSPFKIEHFSLYSSLLTPTGANYSLEASFPLDKCI